MTISDDELAKWDARSRSTYAGLRNSVPVAQIIGGLRDARRKLAAVERLVSEAKFYEMNSQDAGYVYSSSDVDDLLDELRAALAAGEAPTEPATALIESCVPSGCQCSCHRSLMRVSHMVACCPGPVPQGGTE